MLPRQHCYTLIYLLYREIDESHVSCPVVEMRIYYNPRTAPAADLFIVMVECVGSMIVAHIKHTYILRICDEEVICRRDGRRG